MTAIFLCTVCFSGVITNLSRHAPARVERVLAFHIGLPKPSWLGDDYYQDTVVTMDVDSQRQAAYDAQKVSG